MSQSKTNRKENLEPGRSTNYWKYFAGSEMYDSEQLIKNTCRNCQFVPFLEGLYLYICGEHPVWVYCVIRLFSFFSYVKKGGSWHIINCSMLAMARFNQLIIYPFSATKALCPFFILQVSEDSMKVLSEWYTFELRGSIFVKGKDNMTTFLVMGRKWKSELLCVMKQNVNWLSYLLSVTHPHLTIRCADDF